ncbi:MULTISPECIES: hypothetical protein [Streptomyces]|uniref:Secreted protein n=2 Tax=Streptomyces TaxID=1883 RepID=A0A1V0U8X9_STRVN|nr:MULTISPECIES: hypothetical protein [Streptomyces]NEA13026.1 hypothetical protein [Streptomyces sp. SID10692]NEC46228.1 hypothetical protein [Streptomyces sp. SID8016]ARF61683.1 hypothetical protein B1H20_09895 [Streptomyces violaceoruber]KOG76651.1 hypothetical protein ADK33_33095 [Streptomyces griseus subsp. rhodochrous]KOU51511.1 hypothetical protein ADK56_09755 [Streptomyces sp. MMG1522]
MEAVITILALLVVVFIALGVYATVKAVGAAKRGVDRTITQARRTVEDTTLRAKSFGQPGVAGELAQLRLSLRTSMRATQDALHAGAAEDASLAESVALFRRLSAHGLELDDELKRLEREPDRTTVASLLPKLRERTRQITHSAESLRWAARDRARQFADDDLDALNAQIDIEAGALRHWTTDEPAQSGGAKNAASPGRGPGTDWPDPAATTDPSATNSSTADEAWSGPAREESPQAITAPDPRLRTTYPWQKSTRPETTN